MKIITVNREFGSGGRELGKRLADYLGIAYYDKEIISAIAEKALWTQAILIGFWNKGLPVNIPFVFQGHFHLCRLLGRQRRCRRYW